MSQRGCGRSWLERLFELAQEVLEDLAVTLANLPELNPGAEFGQAVADASLHAEIEPGDIQHQLQIRSRADGLGGFEQASQFGEILQAGYGRSRGTELGKCGDSRDEVAGMPPAIAAQDAPARLQAMKPALAHGLVDLFHVAQFALPHHPLRLNALDSHLAIEFAAGFSHPDHAAKDPVAPALDGNDFPGLLHRA